MRYLKYIFFWMHFILFVLQQLALPDLIVSAIKLAIALLYVVGIAVIALIPKTTLKYSEIFILSVLGIFFLAKLVLLQSINVPLIYWVLAVLCISKMEWTKKEILVMLNSVAIVYFIVALFLSYTPLKAIFNYEIRDLTNRFIPGIDRFIGIEGSPAGPDILYTLVLIYNFIHVPFRKAIVKVPVILSIIVLLWTASLSNILALVLALAVFLFYRFRAVYAVFLSVFFAISTYIYNTYGEVAAIVLNAMTTLRAYIWVQVIDGLYDYNSTSEWLLGRKELMEFQNVGGEEGFDANPHNLSLWALQFLGVPLFIFLLILLYRKVSDLPRDYTLLIVLFLVAYGVTNAMPFTTRGDPAILYLFVFCITHCKNYVKSLSDPVPQGPAPSQ